MTLWLLIQMLYQLSYGKLVELLTAIKLGLYEKNFLHASRAGMSIDGTYPTRKM